QPWYDKSMVLEHAWFHHQPHAMDDQFWYDTYICIADTAKIEPMKIYTVPGELIMVKAMAGGAWSGKHEYYNISGNIRFEVFRKNVVVMSALLKGTINSSRDTCYTESVFSAQTIFLEKGRSGWEYYEEKHETDEEALFRLAGIKKERIDH
ncbi:MAG: hypothetical protein O9353_15580, partial [Bacteroidia bacterium]|nr:hypothetical protein [Bacteroidia bacterium]